MAQAIRQICLHNKKNIAETPSVKAFKGYLIHNFMQP